MVGIYGYAGLFNWPLHGGAVQVSSLVYHEVNDCKMSRVDWIFAAIDTV